MSIQHPIAILYIEDDMATARLTQIHMHSQQCKLDIVKTGLEGKEKIKNTLYDAIIIDYLLPDISCEELLQDIRLNAQNVVIIVLSTFITDEIYNKVLLLGADACLEKDFSGQYFKELPSIIQEKATIRKKN